MTTQKVSLNRSESWKKWNQNWNRQKSWINRRLTFSNCTLTQDYDVIRLTETRLTHDVPTDALFLDNSTLYRKDSETNSKNSKQGDILIAINKRFLHQDAKLQIIRADFTSVIVTSTTRKLQICCLYDPPPSNQYTGSNEAFLLLLCCLESTASFYDFTSTKITSDMRFDKTNWMTRRSYDDFQNCSLQELIAKYYEEFFHDNSDKQFHVLLPKKIEILLRNQSWYKIWYKYKVENLHPIRLSALLNDFTCITRWTVCSWTAKISPEEG